MFNDSPTSNSDSPINWFHQTSARLTFTHQHLLFATLCIYHVTLHVFTVSHRDVCLLVARRRLRVLRCDRGRAGAVQCPGAECRGDDTETRVWCTGGTSGQKSRQRATLIMQRAVTWDVQYCKDVTRHRIMCRVKYSWLRLSDSDDCCQRPGGTMGGGWSVHHVPPLWVVRPGVTRHPIIYTRGGGGNYFHSVELWPPSATLTMEYKLSLDAILELGCIPRWNMMTVIQSSWSWYWTWNCLLFTLVVSREF